MTRGFIDFLDALDQELVKAGGWIYLAKDAKLDPELIPKMYPDLDEGNPFVKISTPIDVGKATFLED